ncbi:MAG TPA: ABC transporter permease [Cyclobacteriaceae bacterium]|nr:ABC transporter permease [Cyclobacteriaceae bacterium]
MLQSYFRVGWRNLLRNKGYSFINIGGLALGLTVTLLIGLWVKDELTFDRYHKNYDRLVNVMQYGTSGGVRRIGRVIPMPLESELRAKYGSDFEHLALVSWEGDHILSVGERIISKRGNYVQPDFPEMFSLEMLQGNYHSFRKPGSILLSRTAAIALFGSIDVLNEIILIDNKYQSKVAGVFEDLPRNTTFKGIEFFGSWDIYMADEWAGGPNTNWDDNFLRLYAQMAPNASVDDVSEKIKYIKADHVTDKSGDPVIFLQPMKEWYLTGRIEMIWMVGTIGFFVLLLACVNFMNLSTARSEKRAKEVGIRLTIGSKRKQLITQFLSESFLVVFIAISVAVTAAILLLPSFNTITEKEISINSDFWLACIPLIVVTGLAAGSYPALFLSSLKPARALKVNPLPRRILVVFQFTISICLAIGTIVVYEQLEFSRNRSVGYDQNRLITIPMKSSDFKGKLNVLRNTLKDAGAIEEMAQSSSPVTGIWNNTNQFRWPGKDPAKDEGFGTIFITADYGKTIGWTIAQGRDVTEADTTSMVLNEAAAKYIGIEDPIGMQVEWGKGKFEVVGVVKDVLAGSPYALPERMAYFVREDRSSWMMLRLSATRSTRESLAIVESVYKQVIPAAPFDYKFIDEEYARKFASETRVGKLALIFTVLAIGISCLGLFGLASFVASQKVKEIGIRKVMGASVRNLWQMQSRDFVILVAVSCFIAIPLSIYLMSGWLSKYQYRIELSWELFATVAISSLLITLVTVSFQAIRAAMANPVKALRSE